MKPKENIKRAAKCGSCLQFILLIILSSLITVTISVLYIEVHHTKDDIVQAPPLQHVDVPVQNTLDNKNTKPIPSEIKEKSDAGQVIHENKTIDEKLKKKQTMDEGKKIEKLKNVSRNTNDIKRGEQEKETTIENNAKAEDGIDKKKVNNSPSKDKLSKEVNVKGKYDKSKEINSDIKKEVPINPKPKIEIENPKPKKTAKPDVVQPKLEAIESQIVVNDDKDKLFKLYMEVEELTDEILSTDPQNDMIRQLAPHLETTLKDIELDRLAGINEGLLHIRAILLDLKERIDLNKSSNKNEKLLPQTPSNDGKEPIVEVIPDPVYIAPRVDATVTNDKDRATDAPKNKHKDKAKKATKSDSSDKLLQQLKLEADKNPLETIKKIDETLNHTPNKANFLLLKARTLDFLSIREKSNAILEQAINTYSSIVDLATNDFASVPKDTLKIAGMTCAEKMIFRGFQHKAVRLLQQMITLFPDDLNFKNKLGVVFLTMNELHSAKNIFEQSLKLSPNDGFALVHYGFILKSEGTNLKDAVKFLQSGIRTGAEGTSDGRFYFHLGDALFRLNETDKSRQVYREGAKKGLFLNEWQRSLYNVDNLTSRPIWTQEQSTYAEFFKKLENNWKKIKLEGLAVMSLEKGHGFKSETENLKNTGEWGQFELFMRGKKDAKNCANAPITCALVEDFAPAAGCKRGQVKFSLMQPNTHVWPHTGPTNCRLRAHLGLMIPDGVEMRVADQILKWNEGKVIVFDDSWEHEVWHRGSSPRLILIVDLWHPDLSESEKRSLSAI